MTQHVDNERGDNPATTTGAPPRIDPAGAADPAKLRTVLQDLIGKGDRTQPHREDVLPYLLIRAAAGDRGVRPAWTPTVCWESPDILLIDGAYAGPFDPAQCVGNPSSGNAYRAFVRVFNLGRLPAVGVQVTLYWVDPGFFGPDAANYAPQFIGGGWVDLADRTRSDSVQVVEITPVWSIPRTLTGHECLIAVASCIADPWSGALDANADRRVAQRNLEIATGDTPMTALINELGFRIPPDGTVELLHGGSAVLPLLTAVDGLQLRATGGFVAPALEQVRHGVTAGDSLHLLTVVRDGAAIHVVPTEALAHAVPGFDVHTDVRVSVRTELGGIADPSRANDAASSESLAMTRTGERAHEVLAESMQLLFGIGDLRAGSMAAALGAANAAHLLRFVASDAQGRFVGGYSIVVSA